MPFSQATQPPEQRWDLWQSWPEPQGPATLPDPITVGTDTHFHTRCGDRQDGQNITIPACESQAVGGGAGGATQLTSQIGGVSYGWPWGQMSVGGVVGGSRTLGMEGFHARVATDPNNVYPLPPGCSLVSPLRVWWLRVLLRWHQVAGDPTAGSGIVVMPQNGVVTGWPGNAVGATNRGGFGIVGDGAGQWVHRSYNRTGIYSLRYENALPAHTLATWNQVDFVIFSQRPGGVAAQFELWWNGSLITTRDWTGADLEPAAIREWMWVPHARVDDQGATLWRCELKIGRYNTQGAEVA